MVAAAAVKTKGTKTLLANGLSTFPIQGNPLFSNGPKWSMLCNWVFDNFILARKLFTKVLQSLETCLLVNNYLCKKLFSSLKSQTTFDENFEITSVPFYISHFNLSSFELDNFTFKMLYWLIFY